MPLSLPGAFFAGAQLTTANPSAAFPVELRYGLAEEGRHSSRPKTERRCGRRRCTRARQVAAVGRTACGRRNGGAPKSSTRKNTTQNKNNQNKKTKKQTKQPRLRRWGGRSHGRTRVGHGPARTRPRW